MFLGKTLMALYVTRKKKSVKAIVLFLLILLLAVAAFFIFGNRMVEPVLRQRLHTLIVQGSDSLYTYELGGLHVNFFGGAVEVENLHIKVDSARYRQLSSANALPALTLQLDLVQGQINGIGIISLLFQKKITIKEIVSKDADIVLLRHVKQQESSKNSQPLWKAIQPNIESIAIGKVRLDGVKLLYKNADTALAVKLQFDKCVALFEDVKVDSTSWADTARIAFTRSISAQFNDLKFRTPDSSYKMKVEKIAYSSTNQSLELVDFKMQPTLKDKESFYKAADQQRTMNVITFDKVKLTSFRLDHFVNNNIIAADTVFIDHPDISIYTDKTLPPLLESKIGRYPQQLLLKAASTVIINAIAVRQANLTYVERSEKTGSEGTLTINDMNIDIANVTNDSNRIKTNNKCVTTVAGSLLKKSPLSIQFTFFLDSTNGRFDATGKVKNVSAEQLNGLAEPLANTKLESFQMDEINFDIKGDNYGSSSNVRMLYQNLFVVLRKTDEETGAVKTKKFLTKLLNKFSLYPSNPAPGGTERVAINARRVRVSSQGFFGLVWKSVFAGMQQIMMKSGRYD